MTDFRSGPASMLFRASRTSRAALQWPLGKERESDGARRKGDVKQEEELENREEDEDGLEKREEEDDVGMTVDAGRRPAETWETRLFDTEEVEDVEEEPEEVEDEGLAFCVGIWGDRGMSKKSNKSWWWLLVSRLWFCCCVACRSCCCCCSIRGCWICATCWAFGWEIRDSRLKSSPNPAGCPVTLSRFSPPSVVSGEGDGELIVRSKISSRGFLEDKLGDWWSGRGGFFRCGKDKKPWG